MNNFIYIFIIFFVGERNESVGRREAGCGR